MFFLRRDGYWPNWDSDKTFLVGRLSPACAEETAEVPRHYTSVDFDALTAGLRRLSKGKLRKPEGRETVRRSGAPA